MCPRRPQSRGVTPAVAAHAHAGATRPEGATVADARRWQRHFGDPFIAEAIGDLQEPWMGHADPLRADDQL